MSLEIECKYLQVDFESLRSKLKYLKANFHGLAFEENVVFDTKDQRLKNSQTLLRLRSLYTNSSKSFLLTLKLPKKDSATCKIRDEREVKIADGQAFKYLLEGLGYFQAFTYEKLRETWSLDGVVIDLDTLPFGEFVELEGSEADILRVASQLDLDKYPTSTKCYHDLNRIYAKNPTADPSFGFDVKRKTELMALVNSAK